MITSKIQRNGYHALLKDGTKVGEAWRLPVRFNGNRPGGFGMALYGFYWRNGEANRLSGYSATDAKTLRAACDLAERVLDSIDSIAQPVSADVPIPDHIGDQLLRADWTPKEALEFYAAGSHYDIPNGRTRILDTGAIASNALKSIDLEYATRKGDVALLQPASAAVPEEQKTYLTNIPEHHDRFIWRGRYYCLPPPEPASAKPLPLTESMPQHELWELMHEWRETLDTERADWIENRINELWALSAHGIKE